MATFTAEADVDDILLELSSWEKQEMAEALYDEGVVPKALSREADEVDDRFPDCPAEQELSNILDKIWSNRRFINAKDLETLIFLSKKGLHD